MLVERTAHSTVLASPQLPPPNSSLHANNAHAHKYESTDQSPHHFLFFYCMDHQFITLKIAGSKGVSEFRQEVNGDGRGWCWPCPCDPRMELDEQVARQGTDDE
jgi:hypothetical protein